MHRMLSINRMHCTAEASQADTPDRDNEGGPAKRPVRTGEQRASSYIKRRNSSEVDVEVRNEGGKGNEAGL